MAFLGIGKKKTPPLSTIQFNNGVATVVTPSAAKPALTGSGTPVGSSGYGGLIVKPKTPAPLAGTGLKTSPGVGTPVLPADASVGSSNFRLDGSVAPARPANAGAIQVPQKPTTSLSGTPTSTPAPTPAPAPQPPSYGPTYSMQGSTNNGYTSTDPNVRARVEAMSKQAETPRPTPTPSSTPSTTPAPAPINPVAVGNSVIDQLRSKIGSLSTPSAEEQQLQDELAQFRGTAKQSIAGLEGRVAGEPLGLVRGEQAKLTEQAALQEQTLMERLAAASAQRQAQLQAVQNEYNIAAAEQERQDQLTAPTAVGGSILQFDPATGQYKTLYSAPAQAPESPTSVQEFQFAQQQGFGGSYTDFLAQKAAYSQNPANLQFVSPNANFSGGVFNPNTGQFEAAPTQQKPVSQLTQDAYSLIGSLINHPGLEGATGAVRIAIPGSPAADFKAQLERLKSLLSLENIQYLKGTGAISDREGQLLSSAAAALDPKMSETAFKQELQRIQGQLQQEIGGQGGDDIDKFLDSFSGAPSTAVKGSIVSVPLGNKSVQVSSDIAQRLAMADADYFRATGQHIQVSEGLRSHERQAELYKKYQTGQGGRAAPPGKSFHETGDAIDVSGDWKAAEPYLRKYGFKNELADDKHHFSYLEFA